MRRYALALAGILTALFLAAAPAGAVTCTGAPGCSSGWVYRNYWGSPTPSDRIQVNEAVTWFSDNSRNIYFSGSASLNLDGTIFNYPMDEVRIYVEGDTGWRTIAAPTPPRYGSWGTFRYTPPNPTLTHLFLVRMSFEGTWYDATAIRN